MSAMTSTGNGAATGIAALVQRIFSVFECLPYWFLALLARVSIAGVFIKSGQTKIEGWHIKDTAILLFQEEYKLPVVDPVIAAHLAAFAEHFFPVLLILGLATRFSALALLIMTLIIQIFVYPHAWQTHGTWAVCFLMLMARGPGPVSLDHLIKRRFERS